MASNRYNLSTYILFKCFSEHRHSVTVDIDGDTVFRKDIPAGEELTVKNDGHHDFVNPGLKKIVITWKGEKECENKWLKMGKIVINNQEIFPHHCRYHPFDNEYILDQRNSLVGSKEITRKILFPGETFGWFGRIAYTPYVGPRPFRYSMRTKTKDEIAMGLITKPSRHIEVDQDEAPLLVRRKF